MDSELPDDSAPARTGLTAAQHSAARALSQLAAAGRSLASFDARHAAHRSQLAAAYTGLREVLAEGELALIVGPRELSGRGATLYAEGPGEANLARRLYREGIRTLTLPADLDGEQFLGLLLALSNAGSRLEPREDDLSSGFLALRGVQIGLAPIHVAPLAALEPRCTELKLERPQLPTPSSPKWIEPSAEALEALRAEVTPARTAPDCLALARRLAVLLEQEQHALTVAALLPLLAELRDQLLHEQRLEELLSFVRLLRALVECPAPAWDPGRTPALRDLIGSLGARRQVRRLLRSVDREHRRAPQSVLRALDELCADPLAAVVSVLPEERQLGVRVAARQVLEHHAAQRLPELQQRFLSAKGQLASDLLRVIAGIGDEASVAFVVQQSAHSDEVVQDEALWHLSRVPYSNAVGRALLTAFRQTTRERRTRILDLIAATRDGRFVDLLARHVEENASQLTPDESAGIGRALGQLGGEPSIDRWRAWLKPRADGNRGFDGPLARQVAALLALAEIPGETAAEALGEAFDQTDDLAQAWVLGALAQRQRSSRRSA